MSTIRLTWIPLGLTRPAVLLALAALGCSGTGGSAGSGGPTGPTGPGGTGAPDPGTTTDGGPKATGLPPLPALGHVRARVRGTSARITFDPFPGARDYRVYALPNAADVLLAGDGSLAGVRGALHRCAGMRVAPRVVVDGDRGPDPAVTGFLETHVDGAQVGAYRRTLPEATLGYAFRDPVAGTVPVHAVGDPAPYADSYGDARAAQTRSKLYVLDPAPYLARGWRDDGVAFHAPAGAGSPACGGAAPVAIATLDADLCGCAGGGGLSHLYYPASGPEAAAQGAGTTAFHLCPAAAGGAEPVKRAHVTTVMREGHDELALGEEAFLRARCQGSTFGPCAAAPRSNWQVQWTNLQGPVDLVVEALDGGCPFQGLVGGTSLPSLVSGDATNEPLTTIAALRAASATGEVWLNAEFDGPAPHPVARAVVHVEPTPRPAMDFEADFDGPLEPFTRAATCGQDEVFARFGMTPPFPCQGDDFHLLSPSWEVITRGFPLAPVTGLSVAGVEGELTTFSPTFFYLAPRGAPATVSKGAFLHVVLEASAFTTDRRYPQIVVAQQDLVTSHYLMLRAPDQVPALQPVLLFETFGGGARMLLLELCDGRRWDVNHHCPAFHLEKLDPPAGQDSTRARFSPHPALQDQLQDDLAARFDLYLSSDRAYAFFEGQPYGCADLAHASATDTGGTPISDGLRSPSGSVTVYVGGVLYHPAAQGGIDSMMSTFRMDHAYATDVRRYDYFAYRSGEPAPAWDEARFPCIRQLHQGVIPQEDP